MEKQKLLIVEDEAIIALNLKVRLEHHGYQIFPIASTAKEAYDFMKEYEPDIILMDIQLKGKQNGIDAAIKIQKESDIPIIYVTGNMHLLDDERLKDALHFQVLSKPPSDHRLLNAIIKALE